jgi:small GTP-binding protein
MKKQIDTFKVIIIGAAGAGKTSIVNRYLYDEFGYYTDATIGAVFSHVKKDFDDRIVKLDIWDTAGQERFKSIINIYYRNVDVCMVVCDLTCINSINSLEAWYLDYVEKCDNPNSYIIFVGNKIDILEENHFNQQAFENFVKSKNLASMYVSAFNGVNIKELFDLIFNNVKKPVNKPDIETVKVKEVKRSFWFCGLF